MNPVKTHHLHILTSWLKYSVIQAQTLMLLISAKLFYEHNGQSAVYIYVAPMFDIVTRPQALDQCYQIKCYALAL